MRIFTIFLVVSGVLALASCAPRAAPSTPPASPTRSVPTPSESTATVTPTPTLQATEASPVSTSSSPDTATLRVTATIGPTCPGPQREGQTCTGPYSGELTLTDRAGNEIRRFVTDAEGHFTLEVAPGDYRVEPVTGGRGLPRGEPVDVMLATGQTVDVTIELDNGIR